LSLFDNVTGSTRHQLLVYPDYRDANPYQRLLYGGLDPCFLLDATNDWQAALDGAAEPFAFHLHWEHAIYRLEPDLAAARDKTQRFVDSLDRFKAGGGRFLWTLHNERPHDNRHPEVYEPFCDALWPLVDLLLVHHPTNWLMARDRSGLPNERIVMLPHGHYTACYATLGAGRDNRRQAAGIAPDDCVLLMFGRLDSYKGARELIDAFARIEAPRLRLILAGHAVDDLSARLQALPAALRERIDYRPQFIDSREVAQLFDIADIVATPYRAIVTSGTVMLAMSLGRPVIAPRLPGLLEWLDDDRNALLYDPSTEGSLDGCLRRALELGPADWLRLRQGARDEALRHPWEPVHTLFNGLLHRFAATRPLPRQSTLAARFALT